MTGQDITDRLDAIVQDLQTTQKGKLATIALRNDASVVSIFSLSSDNAGNVNAAELAAINDFISQIEGLADTYEAQYAPVSDASETYRAALEPHQALAAAATQARKDYNDAILADAAVQTAKTAYDVVRLDPDYINARDAYRTWNVSENYGNLQEARGKYV